MPSLRVAVDTGGTFTDCVWIEDGQLRILKLFSTPSDPSDAIARAVRQIVGNSKRNLILLHGTTVGTNALLQRQGARTAMVTTAGFEDAIAIGRQARSSLYDLNVRPVEPLVPRSLRFGLRERTRPDGSIELAPSTVELEEVAGQLAKSGAESIAVCLLFSFANSGNEEALEKELHGIGIPLSLSHRILPEFREYERMSTVAVNAYLQPLMQRYLESLRARISQLRSARIFVMQSSGGIAALESAAAQPVRTVLSGPAGGVVGALRMGRSAGFSKFISFDMGGTSTDVALLNNDLQLTSEGEVAGLPVRVPMLNIHTVGAGGGSLARLDAGGALRVGPESAGADPGPICYGKGLLPTVTDANLLLGRLRPDNFLGGDFMLDIERTQSLFREWLRKHHLQWTPLELAEGIVRVVNATMEKAIRVVSIQQGYDPREFSLLCFGGAGALHACELAEGLSLPRVIVPPAPGALSAYGILVSDVVKDFSRTAPMVLTESNVAHAQEIISGIFKDLRTQAQREFESERWSGAPKLQYAIDMRYQGQGFELPVPWRSPRMLVPDFHAAHQQRFGYQNLKRQVEAVTFRVRASLPQESDKINDPRSATAIENHGADAHSQPTTKRTAILRRESLSTGFSAAGPLVVTEYTATSFVPKGWKLSVDKSGALVLERARNKKKERRSS